MRVIAGTARGIRLKSFEGTEIRPTLDRVRESVFNILAPRILEARFLDLFAGTGANGIEALSRGAELAVFVETHRKALQLIRDNLARARQTQAQLAPLEIPRELRQLRGEFDIIYADPPFEWREHEALLNTLSELELLAPEGVLLIEHPVKKVVLPDTCAGFEKYRDARYGNTGLSFYCHPA